ncbi:hypothetical protein D3C80_419960 [compost metagenome]
MNVLQNVCHGPYEASAAVDAEGHRPVLVAGYTLDQRVLHTCITQVVDDHVRKLGRSCMGR